MTYRKKLIEVSLPLEAINEESAHEKSVPRKGHPATMHLWWARRPLAACRAVLWSSLVDDPTEYMPDEESANQERDRLFLILEKLIKWENSTDDDILDIAKLEIARSVARDLGCSEPVGKQAIREFLASKAPPVLDPFAGGGSIPLEAQRLGLRAYACDLNPVAVLINKALVEIPPKFTGFVPVHPPSTKETQGTFLKKDWNNVEGLAEDVRYYGNLIKELVEKEIGYLYPKIKVSDEILKNRRDLINLGIKNGAELTMIALIWTRTVTCPNPACNCVMPLVHSFSLSTKKDKRVWIEPLVYYENNTPRVKFDIRFGVGEIPEGTVNRNGATCIVCKTPVSFEYVRNEGKQKRLGRQAMAIVAEGARGRVYLPINKEELNNLEVNLPKWKPDTELQGKSAVNVALYGLKTHGDLFTDRQLITLTSISNHIINLQKQILNDISSNEMISRQFNGALNIEYANSIITYLTFALDKLADWSSSICSWINSIEGVRDTFARQAIPMVWDFVEINPFSNSVGNYINHVEWVASGIENLLADSPPGNVEQVDAVENRVDGKNFLISTDPPYYDNIGYADLSDFFYVWMRRTLSTIYPNLFSTLLVPKTAELVATPFRFAGDRHKAELFFENGLKKSFQNFKNISLSNYPVTIYYAFKQSENGESENELDFKNSRFSTGWEKMLEGLLENDFQIIGTWPIRTERSGRSISINSNALASSIVLVCRLREKTATNISRRDFLNNLKREIPKALHQLQVGNIAPVDLAQAAIGPGMAIFSRYKAVLESDGSPMRVRAALGLINQALDEYLAEQEGEYDGDTRWALAWFEQYGHEQGPYGIAETLSKAKNTSVEGLSHAGFLEARGGKVRLLKRDELEEDWDPTKDKRLTAWEAAQYLIRSLDKEGEKGAGQMLGKLGSFGETARDLAYRLYTICERKGWAQEALAYNMLVVAWPRIKEQSGKGPRQESLLQ